MSELLEVAPPSAPAGQYSGQYLWLLRRIGLGVAVVLVVSVLVFAATEVLPSDPARAILGKSATPASVAALRHQLGLDRPVLDQYFSWLGGVARGSLGTSLATRAPVSTVIGDRLVNSLLLMLLTLGIMLPLAVLLGATAAVRRDRPLDKIVLVWSLVAAALPEFVVAIVLVIAFATTVLTILPATSAIAPGAFPLASPKMLVLPVATLVIVSLPYMYRLVRASMIDVLESDYIAMARLKGMPEDVVLLQHALRNALVPPIQGLSLVTTYLLGGVVTVEFIFNYPGLGSLLASAIAERDLPVIQAVVLIFAVAAVLVNVAVDALTVFVSPKLRTGGASP